MSSRISVTVSTNGYFLEEQDGVLVATGQYDASGAFLPLTPAQALTLEMGTPYRAVVALSPEVEPVSQEFLSTAGYQLYSSSLWANPTSNLRTTIEGVTLDFPLEMEWLSSSADSLGRITRDPTTGMLLVQPGNLSLPAGTGIADIITQANAVSGADSTDTNSDILAPLQYDARLQLGERSGGSDLASRFAGLVGEGAFTDFTSDTHYLDFNFGGELQTLIYTGDRTGFDRLISTLDDMGNGAIDDLFTGGQGNTLQEASSLTDAAVTAFLLERDRIIADITEGRDLTAQPLTEAEKAQLEERMRPYSSVMLQAVESFNRGEAVDINSLNAAPHVLIGIAREIIRTTPEGEEREAQVEAFIQQLSTSLPVSMPAEARDVIIEMARDAITSDNAEQVTRFTSFLEGRDLNNLAEDAPALLGFLREYVQSLSEPERSERAAALSAAVPAFMAGQLPAALGPVIGSIVEDALLAEDPTLYNELVQLTQGDLAALPPQQLLPIVARWAQAGETAEERQARSDQLVAAAPAMLQSVPENLRGPLQPIVEDILRDAHYLPAETLAQLAAFDFTADPLDMDAALNLIDDVYLREPLEGVKSLPLPGSVDVAALDLAALRRQADRFDYLLPEPLTADAYAEWHEEIKRRAMAECAERAEAVYAAISEVGIGNIPEILRPLVLAFVGFIHETFPDALPPGAFEVLQRSGDYQNGEALAETFWNSDGTTADSGDATSGSAERAVYGVYETLRTAMPTEAMVTPVITDFANASGSEQVAVAALYTMAVQPEHAPSIRAIIALDPMTFSHDDPALVLATLEGLRSHPGIDPAALDALIATYDQLQSGEIAQEAYLAALQSDAAVSVFAVPEVVAEEVTETVALTTAPEGSVGVSFAIETRDGLPATLEQQREAMLALSTIGWRLAAHSDLNLHEFGPVMALEHPYLLPDGARVVGTGVAGEYTIQLASGLVIPFDTIDIPEGLTASGLANSAHTAYVALGQEEAYQIALQQPANDIPSDFGLLTTSAAENSQIILDGEIYPTTSIELPVASNVNSLTIDGGTGLEVVNPDYNSPYNAAYFSRVYGENVSQDYTEQYNGWFGQILAPVVEEGLSIENVSAREYFTGITAPHFAGIERTVTPELPSLRYA